jgi:TfoX/Sxy family transcriptional regulator of competence genes
VAYDERLAARVRALLAARGDVSERKMFGGLTFMVGGNMCCGVNGEELIVRLDPGREDEVLASPHARPMDFTRRRMRGFYHRAPRRPGRQPPGSMGARSRRPRRNPATQVNQPFNAVRRRRGQQETRPAGTGNLLAWRAPAVR